MTQAQEGRSLRILHVLPALAGGGVEEDTIALARTQHAQGHSVWVASRGGALVHKLTEAGIPHEALPLHTPFRIWSTSRALRRLCRQHQIDLVHAHSRVPAWCAWLLSKQTGIPLVTTCHVAYDTASWFRYGYNSVMVRAPHVMGISDFVVQHLRAAYGAPQGTLLDRVTLHCVPRGIDTGFFSPCAVPPEALEALQQGLRSAAGAGECAEGPPFVCVMPGRFRSTKGQDVAIRALALLPPALRQRTYLLLPGLTRERKNAYARTLEHLVEALNLTGHVQLRPYALDVRPFYGVADVVLVPSRLPEAFGRVMAEGAAMERIVIASDIGAAPEIIQNGSTGLLVPPGDSAALARALETVAALSETDRRQMESRARDRILTHFNQASLDARTQKVYEAALKGG